MCKSYHFYFKMASILLSLTSLLKYSFPSLSTPEKDHLNSLLKIELASLHHDIATCETPSDLATFGDLLTIQLSKFCRDQEQYFPNQINTHNRLFINHENKTIQLVTYKKELRKKAFFQSGTKDDRKKFHDCLKAIRELKKIKSEKVVSKTALHQEKSFNKNRWKFAKKLSMARSIPMNSRLVLAWMKQMFITPAPTRNA